MVVTARFRKCIRRLVLVLVAVASIGLNPTGCTDSETVEGPAAGPADASVSDGAGQLADGAQVDGTTSDGATTDATLDDGSGLDGTGADGTQDSTDGVGGDGVGGDGVGGDSSGGDGGDGDGSGGDGTGGDSMGDAAADTADIADTADTADIADGADSWLPDGTADGDAGSSDAALPDAAWSPDWEGYPDATWPDDADVYGGVITSCFNAYAYVFQEACWGKDLSSACVATAAQDASLYTQYLFQPLRECATSLCVPGCMAASGDTFQCIQQCLGKHCSFPLFACLSQGETGANGCPATFECLQTYEDKIISIASKCFATATTTAQKQLAAFFSCGQPPQSQTCFDQLSACYGSGSLSCMAVIQCTQKCPEGDDLCGFECFGQGSSKAQVQLDGLWDCIFAHCQDCAGPNGCGDACHAKFCQKEQITCLVGG